MSHEPIELALRGRAWTRELSHLRSRAIKQRPRASQSDPADARVAEDALALCDSMLQELAARDLECRRLESALTAQTQAWEYLFAQLPIACIAADRNGCILEANRRAGQLLNLGPKRLKGRSLMLFSTDRAAFSAVLQHATMESEPVDVSMVLRPRERKPAAVRARIVPPLEGDSDLWLWFLTRDDEARFGSTADMEAADTEAGMLTHAD